MVHGQHIFCVETFKFSNEHFQFKKDLGWEKSLHIGELLPAQVYSTEPDGSPACLIIH